MKLTDGEKVLEMFKSQPGKWVNHRYIIVDMGISEYTGRIGDARNLIHCTHGDKTIKCTAEEHIINVKKGWYMYEGKPGTVTYQLDIEKPDYTKQYLDLREAYKAETDPFKRELIKQKGLAAKALMEQQKQTDELVTNVKEALL